MNSRADSMIGIDPGRQTAPQLVNWTGERSGKYGVEPLCANHTLHELAPFSDASMIDLLDAYPRNRLQVFTMGTDPGLLFPPQRKRHPDRRESGQRNPD